MNEIEIEAFAWLYENVPAFTLTRYYGGVVISNAYLSVTAGSLTSAVMFMKNKYDWKKNEPKPQQN